MGGGGGGDSVMSEFCKIPPPRLEMKMWVGTVARFYSLMGKIPFETVKWMKKKRKKEREKRKKEENAHSA